MSRRGELSLMAGVDKKPMRRIAFPGFGEHEGAPRSGFARSYRDN
jgi:hypothetical protein